MSKWEVVAFGFATYATSSRKMKLWLLTSRKQEDIGLTIADATTCKLFLIPCMNQVPVVVIYSAVHSRSFGRSSHGITNM